MADERIVTIRRTVKSVNDWMYKHWREYTRERDAWMVHLRAHLMPRTPPAYAVGLVITSYRQRLLDYANFVAGCKPIPDCLKRLGYIRDDSLKWFNCEYKQILAPPRLVCTVLRFTGPTHNSGTSK